MAGPGISAPSRSGSSPLTSFDGVGRVQSNAAISSDTGGRASGVEGSDR